MQSMNVTNKTCGIPKWLTASWNNWNGIDLLTPKYLVSWTINRASGAKKDKSNGTLSHNLT